MNKPTAPDLTELTEFDRRELLELYKLHVELTDRVIQRREGSNSLYVSILTGLLVAIVAIIRWGGDDLLISASHLLGGVGLLGTALCVAWYIVMQSHRQLLAGKFDALNELESHLVFPVFRRELKHLTQNNKLSKHWKMSEAEKALPFLFAVAYLVLFFVGLSLWVCDLVR